jgi:Domain of unknown function (DUF4198)
MWIEPATFLPEAGQIVSLRLRVGQDLLGDPLPRSSELIKQFIVVDPEGRKPVVGRDGGDPAGFLRSPMAGVMVVGYHSNPSTVELTAAKFNQYLRDEGLDEIAAIRARRNETNTPVHEMFTRCAKSLLLTGPPDATHGDRTLSFPLELLAEKNPYMLHAGEALPLHLTYLNHPLANALVVAMNRMNPSQKVTARTGADGCVTLRLPSEGMWMIKAVHMIAAPAGSNAEWASYWASLTFSLNHRN